MAIANGTVSNGRPVGALACQTNSYLKTLESEVISCVKAEEGAQNGTRKQDVVVGDQWLVECADSVLFPEGGGQPSDHGTLTPLSGHDEEPTEPIPIRNVQRHGLRCILYSPKPLSVGSKVRQDVDWRRRWDHMQQHTGQHLLSAIMEQQSENLDTLGWGMGGEGAMNYVDLERRPTDEEMRAIQASCAEAIRDNHPIWLETPEDAKHDSLPDNYDKSEGVVRVIHIGDLDANPCCGTHLAQTSHVGLVVLGSTQNVHGKNTRLSFMTGDRAIDFANSSINAVSSIAKLTSSKLAPDEVVAKTSDVCSSVTELRRVEKRLLQEIAVYESARVREVIRSGKNALVQRPDGGIEFINKVIGETKDAVKGTGLVVIVTIGEAKGTGPVVISGDKDSVTAMAERVKTAVKDIKGGGKGEKWQGKVSQWQKEDFKALKALVEA